MKSKMSKYDPKIFRKYVSTGHAMRPLLTFPIIGIINLSGVIQLNIPLSLSAELLSQNHENSAQMVSQSTEVPMRLEFGEGMYTLIVPNQDLSQSAYGEKLSFYDVHIAKMFEMTYDDCQQMQREYGRDAGGRTWFYQALNGRIDRGYFYISCRLAYDIVDTYGLGKAERTVVKNFVEFQGVYTETRSIPVLDITGSKVPQWIDFVRGFQPINDFE